MTYDQSQYAPQPPKKGMSTGAKIGLGCGIPALLALVLVGGCAALVGKGIDSADKAIKADQASARKDVELLSCEVTESVIGPDVEATVKITNSGKERANYLVEGEYLDAKGNKVGELLASIENLSPGTSSKQPFTGLFTSDQLKGVKGGECKIVDVTRDDFFAAN